MKKVFEFWFDLGVDGFRLDAVPYLYEREGTSCENLPETHDYLKKLRQHLDQKYGDRMLLAEANQWPEDAVTYFGSGRGDECHMAFHFPLMPRLFMALRMEDRVPIVDILEQTPPVPETGQWALFLRNHDELTLEMVTDEERDYMYRVYASHSKARLNLGIRRRLAPLLNNDRKRIELLNMLLLSLPGTPVLYYGDEIGMGDNIFLGDRNGVRTPMQWSADKNAGFSRCSPQALYAPIILDPEYHYEAVNVETQQRNPHALLWWTKRVLALRKRWKVFGLGTFQFLHPANRKVLAYIRRHENEKVLVLANLSRFPQPVELDLSAFQGERLIELFGRTKFPVIGPGPYTFTLSPHAAFWFSIEPVRDAVELTTPARTTLAVDGDWNEILAPHMRANLEAALPAYIAAQRWFATRTSIKSARIIADVAMPVDSDKVALAIIVTELVEHEPEQYLVPIAFASGPAAAEIELHSPGAVIARLHSGEAGEGILYDATASPAFWEALLELLGRRRTIRGDEGELESLPAAGPRPGRDEGGEPVRLRNDDRNASMSFGERFIIKLLRKVEPGVHPELEAARFLAARAFPHVPPFAGVLEYKSESGDSTCLALLSQFIPNAKNGWTFTLDALKRYFDRIRTLPEETLAALPRTDSPASAARVGEGYVTLLGLISHEYFHTWNVKRLRPAEFARYDYARENYTELLWFFEGFTSYYDDLLLRRAGLIDNAEYLRLINKTINQVQQTPGRLLQSVAQASFDAWVKYYRQDENTPNATVSYYTKGSLVALCLDLALRKQGATTLDQVMRALYKRCKGGPMREDDLLQVLHELSGRSWAGEIAAWVHGTAELPLAELLAAHGVHCQDDKPQLAQQLGLRVAEAGGALTVKTILRGGPAEAAGMMAGDEWLGIEHVLNGQLQAWRLRRLEDLPLYAGAAASVQALVARDQRLLRLPLALAGAGAKTAKKQADAASGDGSTVTLAISDASLVDRWLNPSV